MITGTIKSQIDSVWNAFWTGGISNPLEVIEQITYLLFLRRLDDLHTLEENIQRGMSELEGVNAIDLLIASPNPKMVDVVFLCDFFNSAGGRDLVLSKQRGQVQKHLNVGSLNQAIIPQPPLPLQREFAARVAAVETLKSAHRKSLADLNALFASLQHRAFRGSCEGARERGTEYDP